MLFAVRITLVRRRSNSTSWGSASCRGAPSVRRCRGRDRRHRPGSRRSPARRGWPGDGTARRTTPARSCPRPIASCRSRLDPSGSLESLAWTSFSRPRPTARTSALSIVRTPPGAARSWPAAKAWQVSRQTPSRGCRVEHLEQRTEVVDRRGDRLRRRRRPARSAGPGRRRSAGRAAAAACSRIARMAVSRWAGSTAAPAWMTTPCAPSSAPRASEWRTAAADRSRVSAVGDAKFTRYGAWTNTGIRSWAHRSPSAASAAGVGFGCAQPRGFDPNSWIACAPARSA